MSNADDVTLDFSTIKKAAKSYHELGYNVIRILGKGKKFDHYETKEGKTLLFKKIADGKSAEGTGKWGVWKTNTQSDKDFNSILESIERQVLSVLFI